MVLVALGALALGACGDDDDSGGGGGDVSAEARPYVDALVASMQSGGEGEWSLTDEQAKCVAPRWINTIGVDTLKDAGVEPEDIGDDAGSDLDDLNLTEDQGNRLYDAFGECDVDIAAAFTASLGDDDSLSEEDRECVAEAFDDDVLRRIMVTAITKGDEGLDQDQELLGELFAVFAKCPGLLGASGS